MKRVLFVFAVLFVLVACNYQTGTVSTVGENKDYKTISLAGYIMNVGRVIDEEAGVVCYVAVGMEKGGLSCLPLSETYLSKE